MKVLIVEDEKLIANSIKRGLEQEGYNVQVSYNGGEGLEIALYEQFDVIILDLMLPEINGFTICKNLRQKNIHTPILILSAKSEIEDKVKGLEFGADDYLTKPFNFEELLARLKALVRRPKTQIQKIINCGDTTINTDTMEVITNNKKIDLSKKEYLLLEYLIKNKNNILSKNKIIENVWEYDSDILPNTVEQYINYLRKKLNNKKLIKTIRGFGYKFVCE